MTEGKREEWVKCILTGMWVDGAPELVTLCGTLAPADFTFRDASHWFLNARAGGRLVGCPQCVNVILQVAQNEFGERDPDD